MKWTKHSAYVQRGFVNGKEIATIVRRGNKNYQWIAYPDMGFEETITECKRKLKDVLIKRGK